MVNIVERKFNIEPAIEQAPFEDSTVRSAFDIWLGANNGIRAEFMGRSVWNLRGGNSNVMKEKRGGKKVLYLPKDLKLWEMVGVMEVVDSDTFSDNPERQSAEKDQLVMLGQTFQNAGVYIAQRLDFVNEGRGIAENLAVQFYDYGHRLVSGVKVARPLAATELAQKQLNAAELERVDRWLAGDKFYSEKRKQLDDVLVSHMDKRDELFEHARRDALARYFRVAQKAFERQEKSDKGELVSVNTTKLEPWESATPIHTEFINKTIGNIQTAIEVPKREFVGSFFRRGMEQLQREIGFDKLPDEIKNDILNWENGESTLREALDIDGWKKELDEIRERGDKDEIAAAEKDAALTVQEVVSNYPRGDVDNPTQILKKQTINCVGASMLGGEQFYQS